MIRFTYDFMGNYDDKRIDLGKSKTGRWSLLFGKNIFMRRFGLVFASSCLVLEKI
jgi:hypothetical protein